MSKGGKLANFMAEITENLNKDLSALEELGSSREDRYLIYKVYFETIINENSIFKNLLLGVKSEYEECFNTITRGKTELAYLSRKLAEQVSAPSTLRNYKERSEYLKEKIKQLQEDNMRMFDKINFLRYSRQGHRTADNMEFEAISENPFNRPWSKPIPNLRPDEQNHIPTLKKKLSLVGGQLFRAKDDFQRRFLPRELQQNLVELLVEKEDMKCNLERKATSLELRLCSLKVSFANMLRRSSKPNDVLEKIDNVLQLTKDDFEEPTEDEEEEEAAKESETEESEEDDQAISTHERLLIDCVTIFNMLIVDEEIEEAVLFAAYSPQGVLRSHETLKKLKRLGSQVLYTYWEALLFSLNIQHKKLSTWETIEYVKYSLEKDKILELTHWLAQDMLEDVEEISDMMITHCNCLDKSCFCGLWGLAQPIFTRIGKHKKATVCLLEQGKFHGALQYARDCGHLGKKELMEAFRHFKSPVVALRLSRMQIPFKTAFSIEEAISILMGSQEDSHLACDLIKKAKKEGYEITSSAIDKPGVHDNSRETNDKWINLCQFCLDIGYQCLAEELFAHLIVKMAMAYAKKVYIVTRYMFKKS